MKRLSNLAPVVVFCYNRPYHLRKTITSLQQNTLASHTDLLIYSDGSKNTFDQDLVFEVRTYLQQISGFKSIKIIQAEHNQGLSKSIIKGVTEILSEFGEIIVLEDDMICTPDFLEYMNEALITYKNRYEIFSISGYSPPISLLGTYEEDVFLAPRASSWGWGTWLDRWEKADWEVHDFHDLKKDRSEINLLNQGGDDLWPMLVKQQLGIIDSWAIRWTYCQSKNRAYGLYPTHSKIRNIGTDGSGSNFTFTTNKYDNVLSTGTIRLPDNIKPDKNIISEFQKYYKVSFLVKMKNSFRLRYKQFIRLMGNVFR